MRPTGAHGISFAGLSSLVYGEDEPPLDDPAEAYHEASKAYPSFASRQMPGAAILERDHELRELAARSARRHAHRPAIPLPDAGIPEASLRTVLCGRRSWRAFRSAPIPLAQLGSLLRAAYGVTAADEWAVRAAPSGGALYPLELYPLAVQGGDLPVGVYHYDPFRHALETLRSRSAGEELRQALVHPELAEHAGLFVAVTAMFWRTRFK